MSLCVRVGDPATLATLRVSDDAPPPPGPGEIGVRLHASSLNYHDYCVVTGLTRAGLTADMIPMTDGTGTVEAVGADVRDFKVGDRVLSCFFPFWDDGEISAAKMRHIPGDTADGFATQRCTKPAHWFTRAPAGLDGAEAATLPCAGLTAWRALFGEAAVKPGDWVLVQGSGGVSVFALQFAKMAGARVIATSSFAAKLERLRDLGADHVINYRETADWGVEAYRRADGRGVDCVVEIGGPATLAQSIQAARIGGSIGLIGVLTGWAGEVPTAQLMGKNIRLHGITVGSRAQQLAMVRAVEAHGLRPVIGSRYPLDRLADAFREQERQTHFGKIVIDI